MTRADLDAVVQVRHTPDFARCAEALTLEAAEERRFRLEAPAAAAFDGPLRELWTSLAERDPDKAASVTLAAVLTLCAEIRGGEVQHLRSLRRFLATQFDYFDAAMRAAAGATLIEVVTGRIDPVQPDAAILVIRKGISEFLRNLWSWLQRHHDLPFVTAERAERIAAQAEQACSDPAALPQLEYVIELLERSKQAAVPRLILHMHALAFGPPDERGDDAGEAAPRLRLRTLIKQRDPTGAKKIAQTHLETLARDEFVFARAMELPWNDSERAALAPRLVLLLDDPGAIQAVKNLALLRLIAWDAEPRAVADVLARGPLTSDGLHVIADVINTVPIPQITPSQTTPLVAQQGLTVYWGTNTKHALLMVPGGKAGVFGIPRELFHRMLVPTGAHILYLDDTSDQFFLSGIPGLGSSHAETLATLQRTLRALGAEHLHVLALSGFGFGALGLALDLEADSVLGYSARTCMTAEFLKEDRPARYFGKIMREVVPSQSHDLKDVIRRRPTVPRIVLRYGDGSDIDVAHAENLAGLPGVDLRPHIGWPGHDSLIASILRREFDDDLRQLIEARRVSNPAVDKAA